MMCTLSQDTIDDILLSGKIYEVGGAVRDRYLSKTKPTKDRDYLVTGIPYDQLSKILRKYGRVDLVGRSFGVIKFTQFSGEKQHTFDITLPRKEHSTGEGHRDFDVDFDPNLPVEVDLSRRDFTINAMALAVDTEDLIDPLDGLVDLKNRHLRMTSEKSFEEDPLRMLRAVQFAARFGFEIEPATFEAMKEHADRIETVSSERISEEFSKLLVLAEKPSVGFRLMEQSGLLGHLLPELQNCVGVDQPGGYHKYDVFEHTIRTIDAAPRNQRVRLAALFHDITKPIHRRLVEKGATFYGHEISGAKTAGKVMSRLRYPKDLTKEVITLVGRHMFTTDVTDKGLRRLVNRVGVDLIFDLLDLRRADVEAQGMGGKTEDVDQFEADIRAEISRKPPFGLKDLALNGEDIMKLFEIGPSPAVGRVLHHLMEHVLDTPEDNTRELLESVAREFYLRELQNENLEQHKEDRE